MSENDIINKVANAEIVIDELLYDYNKLITKYKRQTSFAKKIKEAVVVKKIDVTIYNILNTMTTTLYYALLKKKLDANLLKHYTKMFKQKFDVYTKMRESVFSARRSRILEKRKRKRGARGERKEAITLNFASSNASSSIKSTNVEDVL